MLSSPVLHDVLLRLPAADDVQVPVAAADGVDHLPGMPGVLQNDAVVQLIEGAHGGGAHLGELMVAGVFFEEILKQVLVIGVFGNGDLQMAVLFALLAIEGWPYVFK